MKSNPLEVLASTSIFAGISREELSRLLPFCTKLETVVGEVIVAEGQQTRDVYIIIDGSLDVILPKVSATAERLSPVRLNELKTGDCFGEYTFLDHGPASASVIAREPSKLLKISGLELEQLLDTNDRSGRLAYKNLLSLLVQRLRSKDAELDLNIEF